MSGTRSRLALAVMTAALLLGCTAEGLREPPAIRELTGAAWTLVSLTTAVPASDLSVVTLTVEEDRVSGSSGCNRYFGALTAGTTPGHVTIGTLGSTRRMCRSDVMELEGRFLHALERVVSYTLAEGWLRLLARADGQETMLVFAR